MRKWIFLVVALVCVPSFVSNAQMTDKQVIEYATSALSSGKSEVQIGKELIARGVTREQAERIRKQMGDGRGGQSVTEQALGGGAIERNTRQQTVDGAAIEGLSASMDAAAPEVQAEGGAAGGSGIFGHDIFNGRTMTFEPNENAATPVNYRLGPGDQVLIDIWGYNEASIDQVISPEGRINISQVGPVQLSGLTIKEASEKIRRLLAGKYAGLDGAKSSVSVTLGQIRTIQVNVMGEVATPGTYRLSSFATVFNALYRAGGVTDRGSLRAIKLVRDGEEIAEVDVYGYLFDGRSDSDVNLQEGDVVIVPPYVSLVSIDGSVKRPMTYELRGDESLSTLLTYAGGFASDSYREDIRVIRNTGAEKEVYTVGKDSFDSYIMEDGDVASVSASLDRFANKVEVRGYVFRPGTYQLGDEIATVRQLVKRAGGLTEDAFPTRAVILREKDDLSLQTLAVNIGDIVGGKADDVLLRKNDILVVSGKFELEDRGTLTINGMVANPGVFPFSDNTTVEDLILQAGGLLEGASTARVDIARRKADPAGTTVSDTLGVAFSFPLKDGLAIDGGGDFILEPYDVVSVRMSPGYRVQTFVNVTGAVAFPGTYQLLNKNERVSDVIARAGGLTSQAYGAGTRLYRRDRADNREQISAVIEKNSVRDSLDVDDLEIGGSMLVAIDLDKAMKKPGSNYDIELREGDEIVIPEADNTVRVVGEVMFPNAVSFVPGRTLRYYINAAGGYSVNAKKSKTYVVYMNGSAARSRLGDAEVEPGCTIIVPAKPERNRMSVGEIASVTSASSSLASVIAMLTNLFL